MSKRWLFVQVLMRPMFNLLIVLIAVFGWNMGLAIIVLTLLIRLAMIKITSAGNQMQHGMNELQPKLNEIQERYKDDPNKQAEETM